MAARLRKRASLAQLRLANQHLIGKRFSNPADVVRWFCGVQSQDYPGAKWALAQRITATDNAALDAAFNRGDLLRTHVMRPTWHFVAPEDIRWMLELTAPRVRSVMASYNRSLELDESVFRKSAAILRKSLRGGKHLTRKEIGAALDKGGIGAATQRLAHILMEAELGAIVCSGALREKQFTYALLDERVPPSVALTRDEALARLTTRYFESHGPATIHDFAWWSGLRMGDVRAGVDLVRSAFVEEKIDGKSYLLSPVTPDAPMKRPVIHLLPNYDEHIVAYRDHGPSFDPDSLGGKPIRRNALLAHIVTRDGFVVGGWKRNFRKNALELKTDMLVDFDSRERKALERAAIEYGQFMGLPVVIDESPIRAPGK